MQFSEWEPVYETIIADFGYDRASDERARDLLADLLSGSGYDQAEIPAAGGTVAIAGAAASLTDELDLVRGADLVVAASNAATVLLERDLRVDCMVTDLDKAPETARRLTHRGTPVAVHAHGDNTAELESVVPDLASAMVIPTTQARPTETVANFGGFTDGDRAAFLADALGADRLRFPGWDFDDPTVDPEKRRKLAWAERLLFWLEGRRDERFGVLDGRRDAIEPVGH